MTGNDDSGIESEMTLLRAVSAVSTVNVDFVQFLLDQVRGTELVIEDESDNPVTELQAIISGVSQCSPALRERYLMNRLVRMRCWHYQAINEKREIWLPWNETLRCFQARSDRVDHWVESELPATSLTQLQSWLERMYRDYVRKK